MATYLRLFKRINILPMGFIAFFTLGKKKPYCFVILFFHSLCFPPAPTTPMSVHIKTLERLIHHCGEATNSRDERFSVLYSELLTELSKLKSPAY